MHDHYEVLGVARDATPAEIKSAYRRLVKVVHPDASGESNGLFALTTSAYEVLGDPHARRLYDAQLNLNETLSAASGPAGAPYTGPGSPTAAREAAARAERMAAQREAEVRRRVPSFYSVIAISFVAVLAGVALVSSKLYDRVVPWLSDGDVIAGYEYVRADQQMPSIGSWIALMIVIAAPVAVAMTATYILKLRATGFRTGWPDLVVVGTVTFAATVLHPYLWHGFLIAVLTWVVFLAAWVLGTRLALSLRHGTTPQPGTPAAS